MKKIIITSLTITWLLLAWNTFADSEITTDMEIPSPYMTNIGETGAEMNELTQKYDLIIRNNNILSDYEYNNKTYYTKKILTDDLVIPAEISKKAKRIYFLVEEWNSRIFYNKEMWGMAKDEISDVKKEYNYKTVEFNEWKTKYIFNTSDLVKDFKEGEYKSVNITLVAELSDKEKIYLSNTEYISIEDKASVLEKLKELKDTAWTSNYWYYDPESIEKYLEKSGEKMTRENYKKALTKVQIKLKSLITKNEDNKTQIFKSITKETDFEGNIEKYSNYSEVNNLLTNVSSATINQLQKLRSYELIDSIFGR